MTPAGIILAAGRSSRMGTDKAMLPYGGSSFLDHLVSLLRPRVAPVVVVLGHHADKIRARLSAPCQVVINTNYQAGQLSSLQTGIRALPADSPAALVVLVDHPAVRATTLDALVERFASAAPALLIPRYRGRRGHPVVFSRAVLEELLALPPSATAKQVVNALQPVYLDVDDPGVLQDIDTPADYSTLLEKG